MDNQQRPLQPEKEYQEQKPAKEIITGLHGTWENLSDALEIYRSNFFRFLFTALVPSLVLGAILLLLNKAIPEQFWVNHQKIGIAIISLVVLIGASWIFNSVIAASLNNHDEFEASTSLQLGRSEVFSTILVFILISFIAFGLIFLCASPLLLLDGLLEMNLSLGNFVIISLIVTICLAWLFGTFFVILDEHESKFDALIKSLAYSKHFRLGVIWRFLFISLLVGGLIFLTSIPIGLVSVFYRNLFIVASLILALPLVINYYFLIYSDLKHIKTNNNELFVGHKVYLIGFSFLGFLILTSLGIVALHNSAILYEVYRSYSSEDFDDQTFRRNMVSPATISASIQPNTMIAPKEEIPDIEEKTPDFSKLSKTEIINRIAEAAESYYVVNNTYPNDLSELDSYLPKEIFDQKVFEFESGLVSYQICIKSDESNSFLCKIRPEIDFKNEDFINSVRPNFANIVGRLIGALESFFTDFSYYPATLIELTPKYLDVVPNFEYSTRALKYSLVKDKIDYRLCLASSPSNLICYGRRGEQQALQPQTTNNLNNDGQPANN